ncbi:F-box/LRR-repeat protein 20-like [Actinia tenebrosa]|uniref:F-box/LRR-repeat protein 20-like n=1 Tax=Actinia tenebrosa TaxID=6105 RepID=A0A6P8H8X5_ACTTE|nr:F-box/LRR-repeat protein 20-like [Actinia tenebrosa]
MIRTFSVEMGTMLSKNREQSLLYCDEEEDIPRPSNALELLSNNHDPYFLNNNGGKYYLPDVLWLRIFLCLSLKERVIISRVCRKWNQLCRDATFWRSVDFKMCATSASITDSTIRAVTSYTTAIQIVDFSGEHCKTIADTSLGYLAKYCPRLRKLDLTGRTLVTNRGIQTIARKCKLLEHIVLDKCYKISDKGITSLRQCPMLTILSIAYCVRVTDEGLSTVAKTCRRLKNLNIAGCTKVTDKGIKALGKHCKLLDKINLKHTTDVSIDAIESLVRGAPMLSHVQLGILQDEYNTVAAINIVVGCCNHLEFLSFQHHHNPHTAAGRKFVSKKRLTAFVTNLNACVFAH